MTILVGGRFSLLKHLLLLSLFTCIDDSEETTPQQVEGKKGDSVTLNCSFTNEVGYILLLIRTKKITFCSEEKCDCHICQTGPCDMTLKDLMFDDASTYTLNVYRNEKSETVLQPVSFTYRLHIRDDISLNAGDNLTLGVLLPEAVEVRHHQHIEHEVLWRKGDKPNKRVTVSDGNLTISNITASDTGTYKVLDHNNKTLITVNLEVNGTKASEHQNSKDEPPTKKEDTGSRIGIWLVIPFGLVFCVILFLILLSKKQSGPVV
ncbi:uncharacterized protein LOC130567177 isoform X2 [Triplophysa rosa]|uniref:uncharacterized protein LOC130567177 isoform X2 n=1 Tax=Triplophysa rosa TaxID=992332 RepID=UPI002545E43B|nr:uncharacterized protein LOC130567177 isoform X2 [Triplophysa rosa]